jgi:Icc-related predicted phosphoesterase
VSELKPLTDNIIYILGNHEYYGLENTKSSEVVNEYKYLSNKLGIHFLEDNYLETSDFIIYGTTLWSNLHESSYFRMNDKYSFNSQQEILDIHENSKNNLINFVTKYNSNKPLIVVTHHLPSFSLIDKQYEKYGLLNTGFASTLDFVIKFPVTHWIYGHTHKPNDTNINGVRMICNSHGYPGAECVNFKDCTFEI